MFGHILQTFSNELTPYRGWQSVDFRMEVGENFSPSPTIVVDR